ncbi:hypothetical protein HMPREF9088_0982 [Enterococcus italicus DSM 15952]|uniref:Uncharacterized protein n=1 Tax=Enterococcus italicus (strain DSM 15952 / CCUG 50447 / LMG 22039 / TP 1.5) TaxID=888064 RepID=E6LEY1_ENTI1|nr:hypothetical protein HMPREF9088_0982 [Enterococcus italicus DSM 15952]
MRYNLHQFSFQTQNAGQLKAVQYRKLFGTKIIAHLKPKE